MFKEIFARHIARERKSPPALPGGACRIIPSGTCTLCHASHVAYEDEAAARDAALREFWEGLSTGITLSPLVRSPLGRGYRTVSKRKAFHASRARGAQQVRLGLIETGGEDAPRPVQVASCHAEPPPHAEVYSRAASSLEAPGAAALARVLRYVIVRGHEDALIVIFSVSGIDGAVVSAANAVSRTLTSPGCSVRGVMLYEDRSDGRYYLGRRARAPRLSVRKIFGDTDLRAKFAGAPFIFPPVVFSQVNASLVDALVAGAQRMLAPVPGTDLYDLYCGYGLFTLTLGAQARRATGVEISAEAVDAAKNNARRLGRTNARFLRSDISPEETGGIIAAIRSRDAVILDPPRGGTSGGVIELVAARRPARALHMFCNVDRMPGELKRWKTAGYAPAQAVPFDMFPGTDETEILVLLSPAQ